MPPFCTILRDISFIVAVRLVKAAGENTRGIM